MKGAPRFLVDEDLSVALPAAAHRRGFEATHVVHLGLSGSKDWNILELVAKDDWTIVTNNALEFRTRYRSIELHPGVVFLLPSVRREQQIMLFEAALDDVGANPDLVNQAIDVSLSADSKIVIRRYALP